MLFEVSHCSTGANVNTFFETAKCLKIIFAKIFFHARDVAAKTALLYAKRRENARNKRNGAGCATRAGKLML